MEDDDELYRELYGEAAPEGSLENEAKPEPAEPSRAPHPASSGAGGQEGAQAIAPPAAPQAQAEEGDEDFALYANGGGGQPAQPPQQQQEQQVEEKVDDDDELEVNLHDQRPVTQEEEDDFDIKLDESSDAQPSGRPAGGAAPAQRDGRPAAQAPTRAQQQPPASNPASTIAGAQPPSRPSGGAPPPAPTFSRPPTYPTYDPNDPGVLPSQVTGPGQRVRLPGQTRVTPDEYKEFLSLGHGDIFQLEIDNVVDAPWRAPGADPAEYFNYGMNPRTWQEYCGRVRQYQAEYKMQRRIQVYDRDKRDRDSDLPPELAAAVRQRRR